MAAGSGIVFADRIGFGFLLDRLLGRQFVSGASGRHSNRHFRPLQPRIAGLLIYAPDWKACFVAQTADVQIAHRVRSRRQALKLTQQELAQELGVTHQHISRIEGGHAVPSLELLVRLSHRLGVSADYLLTGKETPSLGVAGAIRNDHNLSAAAKRHLLGLIAELGGAA